MSSLLGSEAFLKYQKTPEQGCFDFYRCYFCGRVFSRHNEEMALRVTGKVCPCGSGKYRPSWPIFHEWLYPRVVSYVFKLVLARAVAPWLDRHGFQKAVARIEKFI